MPGLVPGIHVFKPLGKQDVDGRNKSGHDDAYARTLATYVTVPRQIPSASCR
jgi:hypothetical protein